MARSKGLQTVTVVPSASRLISSLRDLGYDFVHSVADLVDNSVAASATKVAIQITFEGKDSWIRIADNGSGMTADEITEAMRYGTNREYDDDELGKFGLGLKTASLAQCRRLTVLSRRGQKGRRPEVRCLDLDHVEESDSWEVLVGDAGTPAERLANPTGTGSGTVVVWESLDRVLGYKMPWGERAKKGLFALVEHLDLHLGMVFHRFLSGDVAGRDSLTISVNGSKVEAWDPFARSERATEELPPSEFDVQGDEGMGIVRFQPYVLPARSAFSTQKAHDRFAGPAKWNAQQGLYIYRANRMIQSGGWCRLRAQDEHVKLARVALDFFPDLDSAFEVNVAKARVSLPSDLRDRLRPAVEAVVRRAQTVYRDHPDEGSVSRSGRTGVARAGSGGTDRRGSGPSVRPALEAAARSIGESKSLKRIIDRLKKDSPGVARDIGW